jgi:hypothetical protein
MSASSNGCGNFTLHLAWQYSRVLAARFFAPEPCFGEKRDKDSLLAAGLFHNERTCAPDLPESTGGGGRPNTISSASQDRKPRKKKEAERR